MPMTEASYQAEIQYQIQRLRLWSGPGEENRKERNDILVRMKELDKQYLESQGLTVVKQVVFTRHGRCSRQQKGFGFSPNSPIEDSANEAMADTNKSTAALLLSPKTAEFVVSPLVRAMQTAARFIPFGTRGASIQVDPALCEISNAASGTDLRSKEDFNKLPPGASLRKRFVFFVSRLFYGEKTFEELADKRRQACASLQSSAANEVHVHPSIGYQGNKIEGINERIKNSKSTDVCFVGHGQNFKAYFKKTFGIDTEFDYGEIRKVYLVQQSKAQKQFAFIPPYRLQIDQKTGEIKATYTGALTLVKDVTAKTKVEEAPAEPVKPARPTRNESMVLMAKRLSVNPEVAREALARSEQEKLWSAKPRETPTEKPEKPVRDRKKSSQTLDTGRATPPQSTESPSEPEEKPRDRSFTSP